MPTAAETVALTPPPVALYSASERLSDVDAKRLLCLPALPSVTGVVCVSEEERSNEHNALNKTWLKRIRVTLVDQLCAQLEELDAAEYTSIMGVFKPQFCVSLALVLYLVYLE